MVVNHRVELIDINETHLDKVLEWRNQSFIRQMMYNDKVITMDEHKNWYKRICKSNNSQTKVFLFNGLPYGIVNITNIDTKNNRCNWGFYVGEKESPRGTGTLMGKLALDYMFNEMRIRKVCAEVLSFNQKSINFHLKLGFEQEGILKEHVRKSEKYVDIIVLALFSEKWRTKTL